MEVEDGKTSEEDVESRHPCVDEYTPHSLSLN
jgi:hypothetical protein